MSNPQRKPVPAAAPAASAESVAPPAAAPSDTEKKAEDQKDAASPEDAAKDAGAGGDDAAAPVAEGEQVEARVLVAFEAYDANDVAIVRAADVERLARAGKVDPHPDAVAYAKSLIGD